VQENERESVEKVSFVEEIRKNSQLVAASWGNPGVFTDTTFGRGLSETGLLPKYGYCMIRRRGWVVKERDMEEIKVNQNIEGRG
jgi:hypothetical protein